MVNILYSLRLGYFRLYTVVCCSFRFVMDHVPLLLVLSSVWEVTWLLSHDWQCGRSSLPRAQKTTSRRLGQVPPYGKTEKKEILELTLMGPKEIVGPDVGFSSSLTRLAVSSISSCCRDHTTTSESWRLDIAAFIKVHRVMHYISQSINSVALQPYRALADRAAAAGQRS